MSILEAIILGLIQGFTEFLPISSSAHLRIAGSFMPSGDPGAAFTAVIQIGTELAVLIYFRHDIRRILIAWFGSLVRRPSAPTKIADARMGWLIIIGTIPIAVLGLVFKDSIETNLRNLYLTAGALITFAIILGAADRLGSKTLQLDRLSWRDGLLFGLAQAMALIPGVSRSGGTISAGLILGYTREAAARYSFLLAIPAVLASGFYQLYAHWHELSTVAAVPTLVATVVSFISGYGVIVFFLRLVATRTYLPFVVYRIALGVAIIGLLQFGVVAAI